MADKNTISAQASWSGGHRDGSLFRCLAERSELIRKVERVAVGIGPGRFSGIRVAIAVAYGLRLSQGCSVLGICSSDAVARRFASISHLGVLSDAKRGERYLCLFDNGHRVSPPQTIPNAAVKKAISGLELAVSAEPLSYVATRAFPLASALAEIAWERLDEFPSGENKIEPIYLREPAFAPS